MPKHNRYVAFLRGINVGGNKLIKMEALAAVFTAAGFQNVKTYIASGNVIFSTPATDLQKIVKKIEKLLLASFGHEVSVLLFPFAELQAIVNSNPFARSKRGDVMWFSVLLCAPSTRAAPPLESRTEKFKVVAMQERAVFIVARRKRTGWFGFPNNWVEKEFGVTASTRNWSTLQKIVSAFSQESGLVKSDGGRLS
jgi:uncharacterized protein (DUF1697 family)